MAQTVAGVTRSRKPYTYEKLGDVQPGSSAVNVMGVVTLFKPPYQSKGRDYTCTAEIVDDTCKDIPVPFIFFNREKKRLPQSCGVGDVLCVRRVEMGEYNNRLQGKCRAHSSWLVWGGGSQQKKQKAPTASSEGAFWDPHEAARACQLLTWSTSARSPDPQPSTSHQLSPVPHSPLLKVFTSVLHLADVTVSDQKINVLGVVKSVSSPQKSRGPDYFISMVLIDETSPADGIPFTLFNPVESLLPRLGDPGCVAYLINVKIMEYEGSLLGRAHQRSRVICFSLDLEGEMVSTASPESSFPKEVEERARALLQWVSRAQPLLSVMEDSELNSQSQGLVLAPLVPLHPRLPPAPSNDPSKSPGTDKTEPRFTPPTFLMLMLHPTWLTSTLREVQEDSSLSARFRVRVKVLQVLQPLEQCCQLRCPACKYKFPVTHLGSVCSNCCESDGEKYPKLRFMYCISLLIKDESATSRAHLSDTDADEFFQNLPATDLSENGDARQSLLEILAALTGRKDPFGMPNNPESSLEDKSYPWIDCCVQTYPSCQGGQLRIVDTWFLDRVHSSITS